MFPRYLSDARSPNNSARLKSIDLLTAGETFQVANIRLFTSTVDTTHSRMWKQFSVDHTENVPIYFFQKPAFHSVSGQTPWAVRWGYLRAPVDGIASAGSAQLNPPRLKQSAKKILLLLINSKIKNQFLAWSYDQHRSEHVTLHLFNWPEYWTVWNKIDVQRVPQHSNKYLLAFIAHQHTACKMFRKILFRNIQKSVRME